MVARADAPALGSTCWMTLPRTAPAVVAPEEVDDATGAGGGDDFAGDAVGALGTTMGTGFGAGFATTG